MRAMVLEAARRPLVEREVPDPEPGPGQVRLRVRACAVCRTDLHILDGELADPKLPLVLGHQIVGIVDKVGTGTGTETGSGSGVGVGDRVGVAWIGWADGTCRFCRRGQENLCDAARFTGYRLDGGYAEYCVADARFCYRLPDAFADVEAAPLLCAGAIGMRALRLAGDAATVGIYGFGAAAHLIAQVIAHEGRTLYAFTRAGDSTAQSFARSLGAAWAGSSDDAPPAPLDAAILFAPVGALVPAALRAVAKGGTVVCAGIHMSEIPAFPYALLWRERQIRSVANLTREDGRLFFDALKGLHIRTIPRVFRLAQANDALSALRNGAITGAAVLVPDGL